MLGQKLSQKMVQKLSPQQIQLMKLLQIPTATLSQRIKEELEANPALDEGQLEDEDDFPVRSSDDSGSETEADQADDGGGEDFELDEYLQDYIDEDPATYKLKGDQMFADEEDKEAPIAVEETFIDHLESQLGMLDLDERQEQIALQLIGSIDEDGYLRRELPALVNDLLFSRNIITTEKEVDELLHLIQTFDPPGVGARDLQECLLIQLRLKLDASLAAADDEDCHSLALAERIIRDYFDEFSKKHYTKLDRKLGLRDDQLKEVIQQIIKLNPKPASGLATTPNRNPYYIIPDFIIENRDGELELSLNTRNAPDLRINNHYKEMLQDYQAGRNGKKPDKKEKEAVMFIKQKIDSARWFIDAIRQRQETMYKTMYAILQYQYDYFLTGNQRRLKPMILKDVADMTGLDISTVSRVANSKFVQTEFGILRLKEFFSESIQTSEGEEVSTFEVKNILTEIIQKENKRKPLSDEKLKTMLQDRGYQIARRTVAKYREQLNIPVARLRKEL